MIDRPVVFIGSSSESFVIAEAVQAELQGSQEVEAVLWKRIFEPGDMTLQALDEKADDFDFAVIILSGDDVLESRGTTSKAPRDNLLFETGLFVSRLGRNRTFYLFKASERPKLPSDLAGTIGVEYTDPGSYGLRPALAPACQELRSRFHLQGPRNRTTRCPALRIDFSYLPDAMPEDRGWRKGHNSPAGKLAEIEVFNDTRFGQSLVMKAEGGAYMDYQLPYFIEATDVEFVVKGGGWVLYPIIDVKHRSQARTMEGVYLRLSEWDHQVRKFNATEWCVPHLAFRIEHDWHSIPINLPKLVSMTFGTEGWVYWRMRGLRLRGHTTLSSVMLRCGKVILVVGPCEDVHQANAVIALAQQLAVARRNGQSSGFQRFQNAPRHRQ